MNESSSSDYLTSNSFASITQLTIFSLVILLAVCYIFLILIESTLRKNKLNWFLVNVCLTSTWFSVVLLMINVQKISNMSIDVSCRVLTFLVDTAACQLMYSHCSFAISRLLAIVYAHKHIFRSNLSLWICIILAWVISWLIALPYLFLDGFLCFNLDAGLFLSYYGLITTLFLPILIVTICNARTLIFVRRSTRRVQAAGTGGQAVHKRDVFLVKLTIGTFTAFIVGWTPAFVIQLFHKIDIVPPVLNQCSQILPPLALLFDVLLLIFTNQPVRTLLKRMMTKILHL